MNPSKLSLRLRLAAIGAGAFLLTGCPDDPVPGTTFGGSDTGGLDDDDTGVNMMTLGDGITVGADDDSDSGGPTGDGDGSADNGDTMGDGMTDDGGSSDDVGPTGDGDGSSGTDGGPTCGDDTLEGDEVCDGTELDGEDCLSQGFDGGELGCAADCSDFDTSSCVMFSCGNDTLEGAEVCDGAELSGEDCVSQGFDGGELGCAADCTAYDTTACVMFSCGNDTLEGAEVCDGADLDGQDCVSQGFDGGTLGCAADCTAYDTTACVTFACGNDITEGTEVCDGADVGGEDCVSQGFPFGGPLGCAADCSAYDTAGCFLDAGECCVDNGTPGCAVATCEDAVCAINAACCDTQWDQACADLALAAPECASVDDSCPAPAVCGDDAVGGAEVCDGADLAGETCVSQGFADGGTLACAADCGSFDTSECIVDLGDCCVANGSAECNNEACTTAVCAADPFCCDTTWDGLCADGAIAEAACIDADATCPASVCGDDTAAGVETCDGADLAGEDCVSQGFSAGGTLACAADCGGFDTSGCTDLGDCCANNGTPECNNIACTDLICAADPFCCDSSWDGLCAGAALNQLECLGTGGTCPPVPVCGDDVIGLGEVCDGADLAGEDCASQDAGGGGSLGCAADCSGFDTTACVDLGDCCAANGTADCNDATCSDAICALDAFCCDNTWDQICADAATAEPACVGAGGTCPDV